ncbi:hypothetical protein ACGFX8_34360 [Streptomyces sp. NPDC048362]|uniref:hypothetical protein n=1 Tax=Streptomyces sp. NPDC048362 TaxID=3365539 RepID=UPI00371DBC0F
MTEGPDTQWNPHGLTANCVFSVLAYLKNVTVGQIVAETEEMQPGDHLGYGVSEELEAQLFERCGLGKKPRSFHEWMDLEYFTRDGYPGLYAVQYDLGGQYEGFGHMLVLDLSNDVPSKWIDPQTGTPNLQALQSALKWRLRGPYPRPEAAAD